MFTNHRHRTIADFVDKGNVGMALAEIMRDKNNAGDCFEFIWKYCLEKKHFGSFASLWKSSLSKKHLPSLVFLKRAVAEIILMHDHDIRKTSEEKVLDPEFVKTLCDMLVYHEVEGIKLIIELENDLAQIRGGKKWRDPQLQPSDSTIMAAYQYTQNVGQTELHAAICEMFQLN